MCIRDSSVTVLCKKVAAVFANLELRTPRHDLFDDGFLKIDFSEQSASLAGESPVSYTHLDVYKRQGMRSLWGTGRAGAGC